MELKDGIYPDLPIDEYHEDREAISKTGLVLFDIAPRLYQHHCLEGNGSRETRSLLIGRAFHAILDGSFEGSYAVGPEVKSRAEKAWKEFEALHA